MNPTLEGINPETLAVIRSHAKSLGMSVDDYLRALLPSDQMELGLGPDGAVEDFEGDMAAFAESSDTVAPSGTYSREDIYSDHD